MTINTPTTGDILKGLFSELHHHWLEEMSNVMTPSTEEPIDDLALPIDSLTRLCFFAISDDLLPFYGSNIFPSFDRYGFTPISGYDVISPTGSSFIAVMLSLMKRAYLVVIDISSLESSYLFEISLALAKKSYVVVIKEKATPIPPMIQGTQIKEFERPNIADLPAIRTFINQLELYIKEISQQLSKELRKKTIDLSKSDYRSAAICAINLLELDLLKKLNEDEILQKGMRGVSLLGLVDLVRYHYDVTRYYRSLLGWISFRYKLRNPGETIMPEELEKIPDGIIGFLDYMSSQQPINKKFLEIYEQIEQPSDTSSSTRNDSYKKFNELKEIVNRLSAVEGKQFGYDSFIDATLSEEKRSELKRFIEYEEKLLSLSRLLEGSFDTEKQLKIATMKGEFEKVLSLCDTILEKQPQNVNARHAKAITLDRQGKYEEAIKWYDKVLEVDPKNIYALTSKLILFDALGLRKELISEADKAINIYDEIINNDQNNTGAWIAKGIILSLLVKYDEAIKCYDKVLEVDPKNTRALYNKACAKARQGRVDESLALLKEAISLQSKFKEIAKEDRAFNGLKNDMRFKALVQ